MDHLDALSLKSRSMDLGENFYFEYGAEEITDYRDPGKLLAALKQKEEEVILAAQLGNALLLENQQLKDQSDKLHEQYADKLEVGRFLRHRALQRRFFNNVKSCLLLISKVGHWKTYSRSI